MYAKGEGCVVAFSVGYKLSRSLDDAKEVGSDEEDVILTFDLIIWSIGQDVSILNLTLRYQPLD